MTGRQLSPVFVISSPALEWADALSHAAVSHYHERDGRLVPVFWLRICSGERVALLESMTPDTPASQASQKNSVPPVIKPEKGPLRSEHVGSSH